MFLKASSRQSCTGCIFKALIISWFLWFLARHCLAVNYKFMRKSAVFKSRSNLLLKAGKNISSACEADLGCFFVEQASWEFSTLEVSQHSFVSFCHVTYLNLLRKTKKHELFGLFCYKGCAKLLIILLAKLKTCIRWLSSKLYETYSEQSSFHSLRQANK